MTCPRCNGPLRHKHFEDRVHVICGACNIITVEGSTTWLNRGPGVGKQLDRIAKQMADDKRRFQEMMRSPITDPRWERIG